MVIFDTLNNCVDRKRAILNQVICYFRWQFASLVLFRNYIKNQKNKDFTFGSFCLDRLLSILRFSEYQIYCFNKLLNFNNVVFIFVTHTIGNFKVTSIKIGKGNDYLFDFMQQEKNVFLSLCNQEKRGKNNK